MKTVIDCKQRVDKWVMTKPTVTTIALIPHDRCRYEPAQGWLDLHDSRFKNKDKFAANSR